MQLNPYLTFNGNCEAAFTFYEQHLGAKVLFMMPFGDSPMPEPAPGWSSKVLHATLKLAGAVVMGSDTPPDRYRAPAGFMVALSVDSAAEAQRIYDLLQENGQVVMPLEKTFWAERFAMLTDRFGIPWSISFEGAVSAPSS